MAAVAQRPLESSATGVSLISLRPQICNDARAAVGDLFGPFPSLHSPQKNGAPGESVSYAGRNKRTFQKARD